MKHCHFIKTWERMDIVGRNEQNVAMLYRWFSPKPLMTPENIVISMTVSQRERYVNQSYVSWLFLTPHCIQGGLTIADDHKSILYWHWYSYYQHRIMPMCWVGNAWPKSAMFVWWWNFHKIDWFGSIDILHVIDRLRYHIIELFFFLLLLHSHMH